MHVAQPRAGNIAIEKAEVGYWNTCVVIYVSCLRSNYSTRPSPHSTTTGQPFDRSMLHSIGRLKKDDVSGQLHCTVGGPGTEQDEGEQHTGHAAGCRSRFHRRRCCHAWFAPNALSVMGASVRLAEMGRRDRRNVLRSKQPWTEGVLLSKFSKASAVDKAKARRRMATSHLALIWSTSNRVKAWFQQ